MWWFSQQSVILPSNGSFWWGVRLFVMVFLGVAFAAFFLTRGSALGLGLSANNLWYVNLRAGGWLSVVFAADGRPAFAALCLLAGCWSSSQLLILFDVLLVLSEVDLVSSLLREDCLLSVIVVWWWSSCRKVKVGKEEKSLTGAREYTWFN